MRDVCPYVTVAIMSCAHLSEDEREREMKRHRNMVFLLFLELSEKKALMYYIKINFIYKAVLAEDVIDTMGAGDSYFAAFLSDMLKIPHNIRF